MGFRLSIQLVTHGKYEGQINRGDASRHSPTMVTHLSYDMVSSNT